jgi:Concanavalin A-like lectin/glucanases superfamily/F5/8 type C domain
MCGRLVSLFSCFLVLGLLLASTVQAADPSLIGWWPFDEESGTTAVDASGSGNDGTLSDNVSFVPGGGRWGGAVLLDGTSTAHVEISAADMSATAGTVMMWANLSDPQPAQTRYFFGHTTQPSYSSRIQLYMDGTNNELDLGLGGAHTAATNMTTLETQTWYHVALTWNAGSYVVYIDGQVVSNGSYSALTAIHDFAWIGNDGNPVSEGVEGFGGLLDDAAIYSRALVKEEVQYVMNGGLAATPTASEPNPEDGTTDVIRGVALGWEPGKYAASHDVYFGTTFDDVNNADRSNPMDVLVSQGQTEAAYAPDGLLALGQTYYWRIDEVNAAPDNTIYGGDVWSFTAEPVAYPIENITATASAAEFGSSPESTIDGSGLNEDDQHSIDDTAMWLATGNGIDPVWIQYEFDRAYQLHELLVWNYNVQFELVLGFGIKDATIEYSTDGAEWIVFGDVEFAQATATASYASNTTIALNGIMAKYVRLTVVSGYGVMGQFGLSEVRLLYIPGHARAPVPADGATEVSPTATLGWRAGRGAVTHEVYLSADEAAVADGSALVDTVTESSYPLGSLDLTYGSRYFWKINEVNEMAAIPSWEGDIWSFSTQEFFVVEDFESYDDEDNRIYDTWLDGWVNETGSTVGHLDAPFAERTIVNGGKQSMPLAYDNEAAPFYSEAELDLAGANWTVGGADTLRLYVQGSVDNDPGTLYVALEDSAGHVAVVTYPDEAVLTSDVWEKWVIPLSEFGGVNLANVTTVYVGVGDRNSPSANGSGVIFIDDIGVGHSASDG